MVMTLHVTRNMDLARGSKVVPCFSSMKKIRKRSRTPIRLQGVGIIIALTPALAGPQVDALGIEFHEEHVIAAPVAVPIQGAIRVACHPGIANGVNLRKPVPQKCT